MSQPLTNKDLRLNFQVSVGKIFEKMIMQKEDILWK